MPRKFIVKLQRAIAGEPGIYIYDKTRKIEYIDKNVENYSHLFGSEYKIYHYAHIRNSKLIIDKRAPDQDW